MGVGVGGGEVGRATGEKGEHEKKRRVDGVHKGGMEGRGG